MDNILSEVLIHAVQHKLFYGNDALNASYKFNIEFEAHLFIDIAFALQYEYFTLNGSHTYASCENIKFGEAINNLLNSTINNGGFSSAQISLYEAAARLWTPSSYSGSYVSSFPPKVLLDYFKK